jgi:hypothetical protein
MQRGLTGFRYAWDSATVIGLFCGFAGNLLIWGAYNYFKGDKALIPFSMMMKTTVWTSSLFLGALMGSMFGKSSPLVGSCKCYSDQSTYSCELLLADLLPSR